MYEALHYHMHSECGVARCTSLHSVYGNMDIIIVSDNVMGFIPTQLSLTSDLICVCIEQCYRLHVLISMDSGFL